MGLRLEATPELVCQPRLTDPGLGRDQDNLAGTLHRLRPAIFEQRELGLASNERCEFLLDAGFPSTRRFSAPRNTMRRHGILEPFEVQSPYRLGVEERASELAR